MGIVARAPAGIPRPSIYLLYQEISRAMRAPDMKERLAVASTPEEFAAYLKLETGKVGKGNQKRRHQATMNAIPVAIGENYVPAHAIVKPLRIASTADRICYGLAARIH